MRSLILIIIPLILSAILVESINPRNRTRPRHQLNNSNLIYFHPTAIKCDYNSKYIINTTCRLRPTRDRAGIASVTGVPKDFIYDLWVQVIVYFKYRVWRPWMIHFDKDWCGIWEGTTEPGLLMEVFLTDGTAQQKEKKPCPFFGRIGHDDYDLNQLMSRNYPGVLPTGDYRYYIRFHKANNETYTEIMLQGHIEATDIMQSYYMY